MSLWVGLPLGALKSLIANAKSIGVACASLGLGQAQPMLQQRLQGQPPHANGLIKRALFRPAQQNPRVERQGGAEGVGQALTGGLVETSKFGSERLQGRLAQVL